MRISEPEFSGVEIGGGFLPSVKTFAVYLDGGPIEFHMDAQRLHRAESGMAIGTGGIVPEGGGSFGEGGKNRVTVRDGFVLRGETSAPVRGPPGCMVSQHE